MLISFVIFLQMDKEMFCNNCWVIECVIDNYNFVECFDIDYWVEIYGKNNCFDYNYFVGKRNRGVMFVVCMKNERDCENYYFIDYNYFGYCFILGLNGGEIFWVGISYYFLLNFNMVVENNYFEWCSGEFEIIFSKLC